jgi:hypothetical protein
MSLRAVGEGHISSIEFRTGTIDAESTLTFDALAPTLVTGERAPPNHYGKDQFFAKLLELDAGNSIARAVLDGLPDLFTPAELERSLATVERGRTAARHQLRTCEDRARPRVFELRHDLLARHGPLVADHLPRGTA